MRTRVHASRSAFVAAVVVGVVVTACGGSDGAPVRAPEAEPTPAVVSTEPSYESSQVAFDGWAVDPVGVQAAAVLIAAGGDVEVAIRSRVVSPAEVSAAIDAIEDGDLSRYGG